MEEGTEEEVVDDEASGKEEVVDVETCMRGNPQNEHVGEEGEGRRGCGG